VAIGTQVIGAISAGIYQTSLPDEIAMILDYMDVSVVFCDDQEQVDKLIEVRDQIPKVKKVLYEDPRGMRNYRTDEWFMFIEDLYELGDQAHQEDPQRFEKLVDQGAPDDICHFCLTSGTTGLPKGSILTHRNYINMGVQLTKVDPLEEGDEYASFLPFAWIGEQMNSFGVAMAFGAPRIYETLQSQIWLKIDESYWLNRSLYKYFMKIGENAALYRMSGKKMPFSLRILAFLGKTLVFLPLINQIGMLRSGPGPGSVYILSGPGSQS
jgi:long-chain acyl-CoA synthetase